MIGRLKQKDKKDVKRVLVIEIWIVGFGCGAEF